jgi:hypothetical protein
MFNHFAMLAVPQYEDKDKAELSTQDAGKEGASVGDHDIPEVQRKQAAQVKTALKVPLARSLSPRFSLAVYH